MRGDLLVGISTSQLASLEYGVGVLLCCGGVGEGGRIPLYPGLRTEAPHGAGVARWLLDTRWLELLDFGDFSCFRVLLRWEWLGCVLLPHGRRPWVSAGLPRLVLWFGFWEWWLWVLRYVWASTYVGGTAFCVGRE